MHVELTVFLFSFFFWFVSSCREKKTVFIEYSEKISSTTSQSQLFLVCFLVWVFPLFRFAVLDWYLPVV